LCFVSSVILTAVFNRCGILKWIIGEAFIMCSLHIVCETNYKWGSLEVMLVCPFACFI